MRQGRQVLVVGVEGVGEVRAEAAERGAVPGLHDRLPGAPLEPLGELVGGDDPARPCQGLVPGGAVLDDRHGGGRKVPLPPVRHPEVLELHAPAHEFVVDGARGVAAGVQNGVAQRQGALRRVVRATEGGLAVRAPFGGCEDRARVHGQPVAVSAVE